MDTRLCKKDIIMIGLAIITLIESEFWVFGVAIGIGTFNSLVSILPAGFGTK